MTQVQRRIATTVAALATLAPSAAMAQDARPAFTLQEAQRLALDNYQTIQSAREQVEQARLLRRQATSAVLPTVTVRTGSTSNFVTGSFEFGGRRIDVLPGFDYTAAVTVSQPLYAGLRNLKARQQADLNIDVAGRGFQTTAQDALLETTRAYFRVLSAQENVEISKRAVAVAEETLRVANALVRAGEEPETSVLRARVATSEAQRELLTAQNAETLARQRLATFIGTDMFLNVSRPAPIASSGEPVEALIATALQTRADLRALDLQHRIAELQIERQRGQYHPVVSAEGTYLKRRSGFPSDQLSSVSVNATWTVFQGGRVSADVATARSQLRQVTEQRDLLRRLVEEDVRAAFLNIQTLSANLDLVTAQVEFARRTAESTDRAYRVGEATDLDVLQSNQALTRSEREASLTAYLLEVAHHELRHATGQFAQDIIPTTVSGGTQ